MKILYRESDGEIVAHGAMPDLKAGPGEVVEETGIESSLVGKIRTTKGEYRDKNEQEKEKDRQDKIAKRAGVIAKFKTAKITGDMLQAIYNREIDPEDLD